MRSWALIGAVVAACGVSGCRDNPPYTSAHATVIDDRVVFEAFGDPGSTVTIPGLQPIALPLPPDKKPSLPLEQFKDGRNEVELIFQVRGQTVPVKVAFDKAAGAGAPFVRLNDCSSSGGSVSNRVAVKSELGSVEYCWLHDDGTIGIWVAASHGSTVTIGDQAAPIGDDGTAAVTIDLDPVYLSAPVTAAVGDGSGAPAPTYKVTMTRDGKTLVTGTLTIDLVDSTPKRARGLLLGIGKGQLFPHGDGAPPIEPRSMMFVPSTEYQGPQHLGRVSTLGAIGKVAIASDREGRDGGVCGPYSGDGAATATAKRKLVDVEVIVYDAATGDELTRRTFSEDHEACPMFMMIKGNVADDVESRPDTKVITRWLDPMVK